MRLVVIGNEYTGKTALIDGLMEWGAGHGIDFHLDDHFSIPDRQFLSDLLSKNGFKVSTAENADDALAKAKQLKPDLVLMDVVMPGQSGFQATRALSKDEATKAIPVIICTSKSQETDKQWGIKQGARDYVVKPVKGPELLAKIAALG